MHEYIGPVEWPIRLPDGTVSEFTLHYTERDVAGDHERFVVAVKGEPSDPVLLRVESSCVFGHVFGGAKCDCGDQLRAALTRIDDRGSGMVIYALDEDARGHGVRAHFEMYVLRQHHGMDTETVHDELDLPVDARTYSYVGPILEHFGVESVVIMTNNPERIEAIKKQQIPVVDRQPREATVTEHNEQLLRAEKRELGYVASYSDHDHWVEQLDGESGAFVLVEGYREPVASGAVADLSANAVPAADDYLVLYVTAVLGTETLASLADAGIDKIVGVDVDRDALYDRAAPVESLDVEFYRT
jgi:GTP cyclohydrolase II